MKFHLPSVSAILHAVRSVLIRFPLTVLFAALGTTCAIVLNEIDLEELQQEYTVKIFLCCLLGLPASLATQLLVESLHLKTGGRLAAFIFLIGLLVLYFFSLPVYFTESPQMNFYRYGLLLMAAHLMVAIAPFVSRQGNQEAMWRFNQGLLDRLVVGGLFSIVLILGIDLALFSLEALFDVNVEMEWYADVAFVIIGLFNTCFFLFHMPRQPEESADAGTGLSPVWRFLSGYILIPLVLLYLVILYFYGAKILISWNWPRGWVSNLIIGFAVLGILAQLLVYPIRLDESRKWIKNFSRFFFVAVLPLIVLLAAAIYRRVSEYGITEERYFLILVALWLLAIAAFYLLRGFHHIKVIPVSLLVLLLCSAYGPWSAFSVSSRSQMNRLKTILDRNHLLMDGHIPSVSEPAAATVSESDRKQINDIADYLVDHFWVHPFNGIFAGEIPGTQERQSARKYDDYYEVKREIVKSMGLQFSYSGEARELDDRYFYTKDQEPLRISGYDGFAEISFFDSGKEVAGDITLTFDSDSGSLGIEYQGESCRADLLTLAKSAQSQGNQEMKRDSFAVETASENHQYKICFSNLSAQFKDDQPVRIQSFTAYLLWRQKKEQPLP